MPFMKGPQPIRRTIEYLKKGQLIFKDSIKIITVNYNTSRVKNSSSNGARDFMFWYAPQIQYKNPNIQLVTFRNMTPSPFFQLYHDDGSKMLVDVDSKTKEEIHNHLLAVACKSPEQLAKEDQEQMSLENPANFGYGCRHWCMCEIPGQVPCPGWVARPKANRGKYIIQKADE